MAVNLNNLTYGRNDNSTKRVSDNLQNDIESAINNTKNYETMFTEVRKHWNGPDEVAFEKDVKNKANEIVKGLGKIKTEVANAFSKDLSTFQSTQKDNYKATKI